MRDEAVGLAEERGGERVLGLRATWAERYITPGPVATLRGVALGLRDPDRLLGGAADVGITLVLVPSDAPGVSRGARHIPAIQAFRNGPIEGRDVIVPLDHVIGGRERAGRGWAMLMSARAAGRCISLP